MLGAFNVQGEFNKSDSAPGEMKKKTNVFMNQVKLGLLNLLFHLRSKICYSIQFVYSIMYNITGNAKLQ